VAEQWWVVNEIDVSVIVVSFNTREVTLECLCSVYEQTNQIAFETIVVDNASRDGSANAIAENFPQVRLVRNEVNVGFAAANNQGMKLARGRYVLLLNSDTVVLDGAIEKTVTFADAQRAAGVVTCRAYWHDGRQQPNCFRDLRLSGLLLRLFVPGRLIYKSKILGRERYIGEDYDDINNVEAVAGCYMLVRREVVEQVGGFDECFFMFGEDAEWCHRIRNAGWSILYFPGAKIIHYGGKSITSEEALPRSKNIALAAGQLLFIMKTQGVFTGVLANLLMLMKDLACVVASFVLLMIPGLRGSNLRKELSSTSQRIPFLCSALAFGIGHATARHANHRLFCVANTNVEKQADPYPALKGKSG
jgi:GT2 family glycosyltransferase